MKPLTDDDSSCRADGGDERIAVGKFLAKTLRSPKPMR